MINRKIAIVTGGSRGLGKSTALHLAQKGVDVILTYHTNADAAYAMMKGALEVLTKYMAKELGDRRIAVNVVAPGAIETDFSGGMVRDNAEANGYIASQTALGRVGLPDDIGGAIASLLSDDNRWVNAQRIEVSGGQSI
jgi:NAD(P)-dependent dehydrogenase (short-subunit alcohol dehydrogenase family)